MIDTVWLLAALFAAAGLLLGRCYFEVLARAVRMQVAGGPALPIVGLLALRIGLAAGLFLLAAKMGAAPLIAALAGFLLARQWSLRRTEAWQ